MILKAYRGRHKAPEKEGNMKKIIEHTYGLSIYMKLEIDGRIEEITEYLRNDGSHYKTTGDNEPARREAIIKAYNELY